MKKILLLSLISTGALIASPATLFEVSPDAYNKQVFTVGFNTMDNFSTNLTPNDPKSYGDNFGFQLSNKATLTKFGYKAGEIYWRGTGGYNFGVSNNANLIEAEIGSGISFDLSALYINIDLAGNYTNRSIRKSTSGITTGTNSNNTSSQSSTGYSGSIGGGIPLGKIDIGLFYEYGKGSDYINSTEKSSYSSIGYKIPITYKNHKNIVTSFIFSSSNEKYTDIPTKTRNSSALIGISWLYNN